MLVELNEQEKQKGFSITRKGLALVALAKAGIDIPEWEYSVAFHLARAIAGIPVPLERGTMERIIESGYIVWGSEDSEIVKEVESFLGRNSNAR